MNGIDSEELRKAWDDVAKIWDSLPEQSPNRVIETFHNRTDKIIAEEFMKTLDYKNILDLGCGDGKTLRHVKDYCFSELGELMRETQSKDKVVALAWGMMFIGVDISREMLRQAGEKTEHSSVIYVTDTMPEKKRKVKHYPLSRFFEWDLRYGIPFRREESFDYITITGNTIGNIESPSRLLEQARRLLKPRGCLIAGSYNPKFLTREFVEAYYGNMPSKIGLESFDPEQKTVYFKREGLFSKWYSKKELTDIFGSAGFSEYAIRPEGIGLVSMVLK